MFAAASLTGAFTALGTQFETGNPGVSVRFSYADSVDLAQQIVNGAPADVRSGPPASARHSHAPGAFAAPRAPAGNAMSSYTRRSAAPPGSASLGGMATDMRLGPHPI
ncbi:MAG: substrate-binding domain-containing protein [Pseudonocardiaceae bacterium]